MPEVSSDSWGIFQNTDSKYIATKARKTMPLGIRNRWSKNMEFLLPGLCQPRVDCKEALTPDECSMILARILLVLEGGTTVRLPGEVAE